MPVTRRAAAAATMADHAAAAGAAAAACFEAMEIDTHVARVIQVELAKPKTRVPTRDIINASRILGDRREVRQLIVFFTELLAPGVSVSTIFADIDDFHPSSWHSSTPTLTCLASSRVAPNHPHLPGTAIKLAQHMRRTSDLLPVHRRHDEVTVVGVIQACQPHSAQVVLEAASRRADEPIDSDSTICRHLEAIDLEFAAAANGKRKYAADVPPHRYIRPGAAPFPPAGPSTPLPPSLPSRSPARHPPPFWL
eukprot:jgi/Tetstr1/443902/TSEL_031854.t1